MFYIGIHFFFRKFGFYKKALCIFKSFHALNNLVIIDKHPDHVENTKSNKKSN
jgi:hypothetical protein